MGQAILPTREPSLRDVLDRSNRSIIIRGLEDNSRSAAVFEVFGKDGAVGGAQ